MGEPSDGLSGLGEGVGDFDLGLRSRTRFSPGCHMTGIQPSKLDKHTDQSGGTLSRLIRPKTASIQPAKALLPKSHFQSRNCRVAIERAHQTHRMQTENGTQTMNLSPNPYPHGRWTSRAASSPTSPPVPMPMVRSLERAKLYEKFWDVFESCLKAENEALVHLVLPAPGARSSQAGAAA
jgi:hypothetical protein